LRKSACNDGGGWLILRMRAPWGSINVCKECLDGKYRPSGKEGPARMEFRAWSSVRCTLVMWSREDDPMPAAGPLGRVDDTVV